MKSAFLALSTEKRYTTKLEKGAKKFFQYPSPPAQHSFPRFRMSGRPVTSKNFALKCKEIAEAAGLKRVKIGNVHLLR